MWPYSWHRGLTLPITQAWFTDSLTWVKLCSNRKMTTSCTKLRILHLKVRWRCHLVQMPAIGHSQSKRSKLRITRNARSLCSKTSTHLVSPFLSSWLDVLRNKPFQFHSIVCLWHGPSSQNPHLWFKFLSSASRLTRSRSVKDVSKTLRNF